MKSATVADLGGGFLAWPLTCSPRALRQYWPRARQEDSPRPRTAPSAAQQPGTAGPLAIRHFTNPGLSPRSRGQPGLLSHSPGHGRIIPAPAGEPCSWRTLWRDDPVYPRVGGGTVAEEVKAGADVGLSPRGRGNPGRNPMWTQCPGSIPAWAGEPALPTKAQPLPQVYPRVGGGTAISINAMRTTMGLSPRGRGNRGLQGLAPSGPGSIPAWAGEPHPDRHRRGHGEVYPRVGGGTRMASMEIASSDGLSPRGRGNRRYGS